MNALNRPLAIALVALGFASHPVEALERSPDGVGLEQLAKTGSDLSKLHRVDFFLHFPTQAAAERAAAHLVPLAFATTTSRGKTADDWVVQASKVMFPVESDLMGLRDKLNAIAAEEKGVYEGWRAELAR